MVLNWLKWNDEQLLIYFYHADVDECAEGTHNCTGSCVNAVGSFRCVERELGSGSGSGPGEGTCDLGYRYDLATLQCKGNYLSPQVMRYKKKYTDCRLSRGLELNQMWQSKRYWRVSQGNEWMRSVEGALHQFDWQLQVRTPYNIDQYN